MREVRRTNYRKKMSLLHKEVESRRMLVCYDNNITASESGRMKVKEVGRPESSLLSTGWFLAPTGQLIFGQGRFRICCKLQDHRKWSHIIVASGSCFHTLIV